MSEPRILLVLECPRCGCDGAFADADGCFTDGQSLVCGCPGMVSVDSESDPWINNDVEDETAR